MQNIWLQYLKPHLLQIMESIFLFTEIIRLIVNCICCISLFDFLAKLSSYLSHCAFAYTNCQRNPFLEKRNISIWSVAIGCPSTSRKKQVQNHIFEGQPSAISVYFTDGSVLALQNQYYIILYSRLTMYCLRIYGSLVSIIAHLLWSERERKPHFIWWWCAE